MAHGKLEYGLRDEQIWWFLQECDEDPGLELAHTYLITPEWQRRFPDAPTVFGRTRFLQWLRQHYDIEDPWLETLRWPSPLGPLQELSLAYASREHWQITAPRAYGEPSRDTAAGGMAAARRPRGAGHRAAMVAATGSGPGPGQNQAAQA